MSTTENASPSVVTSAFEPRYAITFGEVAILHVGGKEIGGGMRENGFQVDELRSIADGINGERDQTAISGSSAPDVISAELIHISDALPEEYRRDNEAAVLVIRNGAQLMCGRDGGMQNAADRLLDEQNGIEYDRKFWNARQKKTMNKRARYNTTFGETSVLPSDDFRTPSTHAFPPVLAAFRSGLVRVLGQRAAGLNAEGNYYFEPKCGIGYHGDAERKIVICLSLGGSSVLRYHWRMPSSSEHVMEGVDVAVNHGDVYVMSEKATGFDWKCRSRIRVVHGAGSEKFLNPSGRSRKKPRETR